MEGITDAKGICECKLKHIFLGDTDGKKVSGYHCDKSLGDEKVFAIKKKYPSGEIIIENRRNKIFVGLVYDKTTLVKKAAFKGKSTFFNADWSRQEVVDCIHRCQGDKNIVFTYKGDIVKKKNVRRDPDSKLIVADVEKSTYPLLRL